MDSHPFAFLYDWVNIMGWIPVVYETDCSRSCSTAFMSPEGF